MRRRVCASLEARLYPIRTGETVSFHYFLLLLIIFSRVHILTLIGLNSSHFERNNLIFGCGSQVQECKLSHEVCCTLQYDLDNSPYNNDQINTVKGNRYPEPTLENDEKYVPYGENNQADVTDLVPPLRNDADLQSPSDNGYQIAPANRPHDDIKLAEEVPIDYNQIPSDTNQQEQYQTGTQ